MDIRLELLKKDIAKMVTENIKDIEIDADRIVKERAVLMLEEIQSILKNYLLSDIEVIDEIINVFEENMVEVGNRHDF